MKSLKKLHITHPVRQSIREELALAKDDWIRDITDGVTKALGDKIDKMYTLVDKFVGRVDGLEKEQTLLSDQQEKTHNRLETIEKQLGIKSSSL